MPDFQLTESMLRMIIGSGTTIGGLIGVGIFFKLTGDKPSDLVRAFAENKVFTGLFAIMVIAFAVAVSRCAL